MSEIQVSINPAETNSLNAFATIGYVQQQVAAALVTFNPEVATGALLGLPGSAAMSLGDSILAIIGGVPSQISAADFLGDVGTTAQQLPLATENVGGTDYFISIQSNTVVLQQALAVSSYVLGTLNNATKGVVELTSNTALDSSIHNNKILVCSQPLTISAGATWVGSGITAKIVNMSSGNVTFSSAITLSSGISNLQPGQSADLETFTYSAGNIYFVTINGAAPLSSTGVTVNLASGFSQPNTAIPVTGNVYPSGTGVQVALGNNDITMPTAGWVNATVSDGTYTASLPGAAAGSYNVWARQTSNNAVFAVSGELDIYSVQLAITSYPTSVTEGKSFVVQGTRLHAGQVIVGISQSSTTPPATWQNLTGGADQAWSATLTPLVGGTIYIWVQDTDSGIEVVSGPITSTPLSTGVAILTCSTNNVVTGGNIVVTGTLSDSGGTVQVGLSTSSSTPPSVFTNATVSGNNWTVTLTEATAGTYYVWAEETAPRTSSAVYSSAVVVRNPATGLAITSQPTTQVAYTPLAISGTTTDENAFVFVGLSTSATTPPTNYYAATLNGLVWSISLEDSADSGAGQFGPGPGTYYVWVKETQPNIGVTVSSSTISITAPPVGISLLPIPSTGSTSGTINVAGAVTISSSVGMLDSGAVTPGNAGCVYLAFSTSNTVQPAPSAFQAAFQDEQSSLTSGGFTATMTLPSPGTYYLWAVYVNIYGTPYYVSFTNNSQVIYQAVSSTSIVVTEPAGTVSITTFPSTATTTTPFTVGGTVGDSGGTVQVGLSTSNTTPPGTYYNATVSGNSWTYNFTEGTAGNYYLWVKETTPSIASAVSSTTVAVSLPLPPVVINSFTTPVLPSGAVMASGTCETGSSINVGFSTSNTTPPTSFTGATVSGTSWSVTLTAPATPGNYYIWAEETTPHVQQAISSTLCYVVSTDASFAVNFGTNAINSFNTTFTSFQSSASPNVVYVNHSGTVSSWACRLIPTTSGQLSALPGSVATAGSGGVIDPVVGPDSFYDPGGFVGFYLNTGILGTYYLTIYALNGSGAVVGVGQTTPINFS